MTPPLSTDLRQRIVDWRTQEGWTYKQIAHTARCSIGTVHNILMVYKQYGQVTNPLLEPTGRKQVLGGDDINYLCSILMADPTLYVDELREWLDIYRGVTVSLTTIIRTLARMDLTHKHIEAQAAERNEELRSVWQVNIGQYEDPEVFVFLDESAVDNVTMQHKDGWSALGQKCVWKAMFIKSTRFSILPALSLDRIMVC
jgi:transposase